MSVTIGDVQCVFGASTLSTPCRQLLFFLVYHLRKSSPRPFFHLPPTIINTVKFEIGASVQIKNLFANLEFYLYFLKNDENVPMLPAKEDAFRTLEVIPF